MPDPKQQSDTDDVFTGEVGGQEAFTTNMKRLVANELDYDVELRKNHTKMLATLDADYMSEKHLLRAEYLQDRAAARDRSNAAHSAAMEHARYGLDRLWATSDTEQAAAATMIARELMNQPTDRLAQLLALIKSPVGTT
jgi:hypothetical protein